MKDSLLIKYLTGNTTKAERKLVFEWIEAHSLHKEHFLALRKLHNYQIWNKAQQSSSTTGTSSIHWWKEVIKIAAILVSGFISLYALGWINLSPTDKDFVVKTLQVPAGQRAELTLSDGTTIWLNAQSTLTFPSKFSEKQREVTLNGEGFFNVTHNEKKPFIVKTQHYNIKVLGTTFNVLAYNNEPSFNTALIIGKVAIESNSSDTSLFLTPGTQASLNQTGQLITKPITSLSPFAWKKGLIAFENEPVSKLLKTLKRQYDINIEIKNKELEKHYFTGKFRTSDGIEHVLKTLQLKCNFKYKIDRENNLIFIN